jgi:hypothetical protein
MPSHLDRQLSLHVRQDGKVVAVVTAPYLDIAISRHVFSEGWTYVIPLVARAAKEWDRDELTYRVLVTFETE